MSSVVAAVRSTFRQVSVPRPTAKKEANSITSVETLVEVLRETGLLKPAQLEELQDLKKRFPNHHRLSCQLLGLGWLTYYQVDQLLERHGQDLMLGDYVLLDRLGQGGMGAVFKARHRSSGRVVALKFVPRQLASNTHILRRFQREMGAIAKLSHPNIVQALDAGEIDGRVFLVMEFVEGIDLDRLVQKSGPLPVEESCDYIRQAALGLHSIHENGLVHRDVKPANLLLAHEGSVVKILDLGLVLMCKVEGTDPASILTQEGSMVGTADFLAPEQASNAHAVDCRADLYSLGCSFYYLLSSKTPFPDGTATQKVLKHRLDPPAPLDKLRPDVPRPVAAIVHRLMAKCPDDRYATAAEVVRHLDSLPIS